MRPAIAFVVVLLLSIAAGWWWLQQSDQQPTPPRSDAPTATAPATPARSDAGPTEATPPTTAPERTVAEAAAPAPAAPAAKPQRHLHGTITVVGDDGTEQAHCSGHFAMDVWIPDDKDQFTTAEAPADVHDGRWEVNASADGTELQLGTITLDGRAAWCRDQVPIPKDDVDIVIRVEWVPHLHLRVLGDDTGSDLAELHVVTIRDARFEDLPHPGNQRCTEVASHARSPLELLPSFPSDTARYWVVAPGYAWGAVELDTREKGERVLRLLPGGDVELAIVGAPPADAVVRVRPAAATEKLTTGVVGPDDAPTAEFATTGARSLRLDALPKGMWSLTLEFGDWFYDHQLLGATTVSVQPGSSAPATITVQYEAIRPPTVTIHGTLTVSRRWGEEIALAFQPSSPLAAWQPRPVRLTRDEMQHPDDRTYTFRGLRLLAGRWLLVVDGTQHRRVVEIAPDRDQLDIDVPDPADVRVRVIDDDTGLAIPGAHATWYASTDNWPGGVTHDQLAPGDDGWLHCVMPIGKITVHTKPDGYDWSHEDYDVRPAGNDFVIRVRRVCGVEIVLLDDAVALPFPDSARVELEHTTTKSGVSFWSGSKVAAVEPGEHVLTISGLDGFEPIPPRKVDIESGHWTRVEIALRHKL